MYKFLKLGENHKGSCGDDAGVSKAKDPQEFPEQLKCPICFDIPQVKIYQCKNGHTICATCLASVRKCPQCRVAFEVDGALIRNLALEALLDSMAVFCPYNKNGCKQLMSRKQVKSHMIDCMYK